MANKTNKREVRFELLNEDYKAFGRYRILYTDQGHKMVRRQRITYILSGVIIALLFTIFKVDHSFTILTYVIAAALVVVGLLFAEPMVLRQQDRVIEGSSNSAERVHAGENIIRFDDDTFTTFGDGDEQTFQYSDIKLVDLTEEAIYVWMSDTMIMPVPLHAFRGMEEMKELYKWLKERTDIKEEGAGE